MRLSRAPITSSAMKQILVRVMVALAAVKLGKFVYH
jgi:hypothetical protein